MPHLFLLSGGWTQGIQLFVALSILILVHEWGHFFFAKLFKTRVEKFYLFFDFLFPFAKVLNFALWKKTKGGTEYGLGWFPLGGYVKIAGMVDESMDKEALAKPPEPWEFRAKPAWQRLFIMLGGIIVNVLVAIIVYTSVFAIYGETTLPNDAVKYGVAVDSLGRSIGFRSGDRIISADGKEVKDFRDVSLGVLLDGVKTVQIDRGGQRVDIAIPDGTIRAMMKKALITPRIPIIIEETEKKTEAARMQLMPGDSIIAVNGIPTPFFDQFDSIKNTLKGKPIRINLVRNGGSQGVFEGTVPADGILGIGIVRDPERFFAVKHTDYNVLTAIPRGVEHTGEQFNFYWKQLKLIFTKKEIKASESLGGIGTFAKLFPPQFDMEVFLGLLAFVSLILAFMNLLPIPGLDGGYVVFTLWEMITGRKVNDKVMEVATTIGLVLLLALMLYANGMDIFRAFKK